MSKIKVPSLQHLSRIWRPDPVAIKRVLIGLAKHGPSFSYEPMHGLVRDMLLFGTPYDQIVEGVKRGIKREDVRKNFLGLLPLIRDHFNGVSASYVQDVAPRFYPVSRGLLVPFRPPLIYGANGTINFPWLSYWRSNPLAEERLSLFVTVVEEVLLQDSDLEDAKFTILDFSAPLPGGPRELNVIDAGKVKRLTSARKKEMLSIFAEGYRLAKQESTTAGVQSKVEGRSAEDDDQFGLFDPA